MHVFFSSVDLFSNLFLILFILIFFVDVFDYIVIHSSGCELDMSHVLCASDCVTLMGR